jgi:hypothetical protein
MIAPTSLQIDLKTLQPLEQEVYAALAELGPAHNLRIQEFLRQKETVNKRSQERRDWPINVVCGRVNTLHCKGQIVFAGYYRGYWNGKKKTYKFWALTADSRQPAGWVKLTPEEVEAMRQKTEGRIQQKESRRERKFRQVFTPSDFGRELARLRYKKQQERLNKKQHTLFI